MLTICLFSTLEVSSKLLAGGISPHAIAAWRFLIGGLVLLPVAINQMVTRKIKFRIGSILLTCALGILNVCISMLLLQWSVVWGKASLSAIIISINPLFVSIFAFILLKEKLNDATWLGLIVGIVGLIMVIWGENNDWNEAQNLLLGIILALLATICFALYTVLAKKLVSRYGNLTINSFSFLCGSLVLSLIYLIQGKSLAFQASQTNILLILWLGVFVSGIAYILYFEGMKKLPASTASMYFFLKPVIASLLAWLISGEHLSPIQITGVLVIVISQYLFRRQSMQDKVFFSREAVSGSD